MAIGTYIKSKQPLVFRTFSNAIKTGRLSHAYLLCGEAGTPLKATAIYLAKSLLCDHPDPLADETCITCQRIDRGEYPDCAIFDGENESIKKDAMTELVASFQKTALEKKGIKIYVIHQIENMTTEAINCILKFLEEPNPNTYAILTTQNEAKVLPTIISRCEKIRLLLAPRSQVIEEAVSLGVERQDAEILSFFYNDPDSVSERSKSEEYADAKKAFESELDALTQNSDYARFVMEKEVAGVVSNKPAARFYFDMLTLAFEDMVSYSKGKPIVLSTYKEMILAAAKALPHLEQSLQAIMTLRSDIERNIDIPLILIHLVNQIYKE